VLVLFLKTLCFVTTRLTGVMKCTSNILREGRMGSHVCCVVCELSNIELQMQRENMHGVRLLLSRKQQHHLDMSVHLQVLLNDDMLCIFASASQNLITAHI
jgi:hypothetical protein